MTTKNWFADCNTFEELTEAFKNKHVEVVEDFEEWGSKEGDIILNFRKATYQLRELCQQYIMILENNFEIRKKQ